MTKLGLLPDSSHSEEEFRGIDHCSLMFTVPHKVVGGYHRTRAAVVRHGSPPRAQWVLGFEFKILSLGN